MEDSVAEIKRRINVVSLVGEYVTLKKMGRNHKGLCPFHGEKTPSFMVNEELGIYKCFGCGVGGDIFNFVMEIEGLDFGEALRKLADKAGVKLPEFKSTEKDYKKELIGVNTMASEYFHYLLVSHPSGEVARKYLEDRKINKKLWETFKLGFALSEWDGLSKYLVGKKGYDERVLLDAGLAIDGKHGIYDRFRGRLMFPLLDGSGRVVGFSGRILPELATNEEAKYMNSPETEVYHKGRMLYGFSNARVAIKKKNRVVMVEGQMDTISSFGAGITETVGVGGTALTVEMVEMVGRVTNNIILALDNDIAGEAAMKRSIDLAEKRGLSIKMVEMEGGKDPDEISRNLPNKWKEMVDKAVPVYEFFFNRLISRYGTESVEGISMIVKEIVPMLTSIENSVIREVWVRKLAEKIGVDKQRIEEEMDKARRMEKRESKNMVETENMPDRTFMGMLLAASDVERGEIKKMFLGLPAIGAEGKLLVLILNEDKLNLVELRKDLAPELIEVLEQAALAQPEEVTEKELVKVAIEWGKRTVREERMRLTEEIREAEKSNGGADSASEPAKQTDRIDNLMGKLVKLNAIEKRLG